MPSVWIIMSCLGKDISHIPLTLVTALSRVLQPATRLASSPCSASTSSSITAVTRLVPAPRLWKYFYSVTNIFNVTFAVAGLQIRLIVCSSERCQGRKWNICHSIYFQTITRRWLGGDTLYMDYVESLTDTQIILLMVRSKKILTRGFFWRCDIYRENFVKDNWGSGVPAILPYIHYIFTILHI